MTQSLPIHKHLAKGAFVNLLGALAKVSRAVFLIVFSRLLGSELFGLYILAFSIQEIVGKIAVLGFDQGMMRLAGHLKHEGREDEIRQATMKVVLVDVVVSSLVALLFAFLSTWIAITFLQKPTLASPLRNFCFGMPAVCVTSIFCYSYRPTLDMRYEVYVRSLWEPLIILVLGYTAVKFNMGVVGIVYAHNLAAFVAMLIAFGFFSKLYPRSEKKVLVDWKYLWNTSFPMGSMELIAMFKQRLDLMVIARLMPLSSVGIYGAIVEIGNALRKTRALFDPILMPIAQFLHARKESAKLNENLALAVRWVTVPAFGMLGPMLIVPEAILHLFGEGFVEGGLPLAIFAVGQIFWVSLGLMESVLAITGFAYVTLVNSLVLVTGNFILLCLFIPRWGLTGAATATSISFILVTIWRLVQGKKLLGIWPFHRSQLGPLAAFCIALLGGAISRAVLSADSLRLQIVSGGVFVTIYGIALLFLRRAGSGRGGREARNGLEESDGKSFGAASRPHSK